ncbi:MAG: carbon-nitrogen hydrolase family protein [Motiliproteus sp.]
MAIAAVIQMVSGEQWQSNLDAAASLIAKAAASGAKLALLPENFAVFNSAQLCQRGALETSPEGPIRGFLSEQARLNDIWLIGGSVPVMAASGDRVRAACFVLDNEGKEQARYDKLHLFDVDVADQQAAYRESQQIEPGQQVVVVDTPVGRLGLSICYDLRFPLLYQAMLEQGAEIISVPAAFTKVTGEAHWELLLRARATETQSYLLAANQGGRHSESRETYGHSMIIDPWGKVMTSLDAGPGVASAELDLQWLREVRRKMPVYQHRRDPRAL